MISLDGSFSTNENGDRLIELSGKNFRIDQAAFMVVKKNGYYSQSKGATEKHLPDSIPIDIGDVIVRIDAPTAEKIGMRYAVFVYAADKRAVIADLFKFIQDIQNPPQRVFGSIQDSKDFKEDILEIETKEKATGTCTYCKDKAIDSCTICRRGLCRKHDILAGWDHLTLRLGYCEDCLYYLNLIEVNGDIIP